MGFLGQNCTVFWGYFSLKNWHVQRMIMTPVNMYNRCILHGKTLGQVSIENYRVYKQIKDIYSNNNNRQTRGVDGGLFEVLCFF